QETLMSLNKPVNEDWKIPDINDSAKEACVKLAKAIDKIAEEVDIDFIGGFSAYVHKGFTRGDFAVMMSLPEVLSETERVCCSINVATTKSGMNMTAIKIMGNIIKDISEKTKESDSIGGTKLVVFSNAVEDNPFMAGSFHGIGEADSCINVGISGPGVVKSVISHYKKADFETLSEVIKKTAFKITRMGQLIAQEASKRLNIPFGIVDLSLAPTTRENDSVAGILEEMGLEYVGAPGSTAALALLNDAVKKGGLMASSYVGGLSGAFIPVSEDLFMNEAAKKGALTIEKLEAMTSVCSVGLDMIAIPGDTPPETISGIIADEAAIGLINNKTTGVRIIPVIGKKEGESATWGGLLGEATIMPVKKYSCSNFINRKGRFPAPIHSQRN
ncbi:MAG: PFL family protein, partial [Promethearchaeota archaeon]